MNDKNNRILMSDAIKGMIPALEEDQIKDYEDSFVIVALVLDSPEPEIITGNLVGISRENPNSIKIDFRSSIEDAYSFFKKCIESSIICKQLCLDYVSEIIQIQGLFEITSPRLVDFDRQNKMCTLGIDLIKT